MVDGQEFLEFHQRRNILLQDPSVTQYSHLVKMMEPKTKAKKTTTVRIPAHKRKMSIMSQNMTHTNSKREDGKDKEGQNAIQKGKGRAKSR